MFIKICPEFNPCAQPAVTLEFGMQGKHAGSETVWHYLLKASVSPRNQPTTMADCCSAWQWKEICFFTFLFILIFFFLESKNHPHLTPHYSHALLTLEDPPSLWDADAEGHGGDPDILCVHATQCVKSLTNIWGAFDVTWSKTLRNKTLDLAWPAWWKCLDKLARLATS